MKHLLLSLAFVASCKPDAPAAPSMTAASQEEKEKKPAQDIVKFEAPAAWKKEDPTNNMRKAQYKVPDKEKKAADGEMVLFYFGARNDMLQANLQRWAQQMGADDPKASKIEGKHPVTLVDLTGTYTGDADAGAQENSRLLAAVVETDSGPWYFKLVGPAETVGDWKDEYIAMLKAATK